jgi:hypothetical protein
MTTMIVRIAVISIVTVAASGFGRQSNGQDAALAYEACKKNCMGRHTDVDHQQKCEALCVNFKRAADMHRACLADELCRMQNGYGR